MAGFIYIMSNPAFSDRIKIGKSSKDPTIDRVNELNQTGVPEPYHVEYYAFVEDADYLEKVVHKHFNEFRPNKKREFFHVDCADAIYAIRELAERHSKIKLEGVFYTSAEELETRKLKREAKLKKEAEEQERKAKELKEKADELKAEKQKAKMMLQAEIQKEFTAKKKLAWRVAVIVPIYQYLVALISFHVMKNDPTTSVAIFFFFALCAPLAYYWAYPSPDENKIDRLSYQELENSWQRYLTRKKSAAWNGIYTVLKYYLPLSAFFALIGVAGDDLPLIMSFGIMLGALAPFALVLSPYSILKELDIKLTYKEN